MIHSNFRVGTVFTICENICAFVLTEMANSEVRLDNHLYFRESPKLSLREIAIFNESKRLATIDYIAYFFTLSILL